MTNGTVDRTPSLKTVAREQLRVVGLAVRREALLVCGALVVFMLIVPLVDGLLEEFMDDGQSLILDPAVLGMLAAMLALVSPLAVWKGETRFGESQLWSLPADHSRHVRIKVAAGWVWLMAVVTFGFLSIVLFVVLVGGALGADEVRLLATNVDSAASGAAGPLQEVPWSTPLWQWSVPFAAASAVYLAASAFLLGLRHPWHWAVGGYLFALALALLAEGGSIAWVKAAADGLVFAVDSLVTSGSESAQFSVFLESGERTRAWTRLPSIGPWLVSTVLWTGLAGVALWGASARHREA